MFKFFKRPRAKIHFCGERYIIEPKYRLFYISEDGKHILTYRFPAYVLEVKMHRPFGGDIFGGNVIGLEEGDIFIIIVRNFEANPIESILEKTRSVSRRYIRYNGKGNFEELNVEKFKKGYNLPYITIF